MRIEAIEDILDEFDFHRVQKVMDFLDWQWATAVDGVPSVGEMRRQARKLLEFAHAHSDKPSYSVATGGFEAACIMEEGDKTKYLSLKFVIEEGNNYE